MTDEELPTIATTGRRSPETADDALRALAKDIRRTAAPLGTVAMLS